MTTIRVAKRPRYVSVDRRTVNDSGLSWKARGILVWLLDKPDDWETSIERLAEEGPDGEYAVRQAVRELEAAGYVSRRRHRGLDGRWVHEWLVSERPPAETADGPPAEIAPGPPAVIHERETAGSTETLPSGVTEQPKTEADGAAAGHQNRRHRMPADWIPSAGLVAWTMTREGWTEHRLAEQVDAFRDYHLAHGSVMLSWDRAWMTWARNGEPGGRFAPRSAIIHSQGKAGRTQAVLDDIFGPPAIDATATEVRQ